MTADLAAVLEANRARYLRFLSARLGGPDDAEDILQEVWLKLSRLDPVEDIADPVAYVFRVLDNAVRDRRRTAARRQGLDKRWSDLSIDNATRLEAPPTPEDIAIVRSRLRHVERALADLPERTRQIFHASRIEGRPQKEIADGLGISVSAVEKHLQRAYKTVAATRRDIDAAEIGGG